MFGSFIKKPINMENTIDVTVSLRLVDLYNKQQKNYDYAISSALDCLDPKSYIEAFRCVDSFKLKGETTVIKIGDTVAEKIKNDLEIETLEAATIEMLLWIGVILPEV